MSIGAHAIADKRAIDARPALTGMLVFFKYQCARAFAQYKAVAVTVPRAGSCGWIVVAGGKRTHGGKAAYAQRRYCRFGAARHHDVGVAIFDKPSRLPYGVQTCRAGGNHSLAWPFKASQTPEERR